MDMLALTQEQIMGLSKLLDRVCTGAILRQHTGVSIHPMKIIDERGVVMVQDHLVLLSLEIYFSKVTPVLKDGSVISNDTEFRTFRTIANNI